MDQVDDVGFFLLLEYSNDIDNVKGKQFTYVCRWYSSIQADNKSIYSEKLQDSSMTYVEL